jgi:type IV pilus assembly protein PilQ
MLVWKGLRMRRTAAVIALLLSWPLGAATASAAPPRAKAKQQTINLDVRRADIRDVLRLLAEVGGVNLVYGEEVTGEVTLRLIDVPWDQALWVVLSSKNLSMEREGNIVRVAPSETFAKEREAQLDAREQCRKHGKLRTRLIPVSHARASELLPHIAATLTPRGTVSVDERTNTLIVRDVDCP